MGKEQAACSIHGCSVKGSMWLNIKVIYKKHH